MAENMARPAAVRRGLWIARWSGAPYPLPNGWPRTIIWQYTSRGHVEGITGVIDRNVFTNTHHRLQALARCTNEAPC